LTGHTANHLRQYTKSTQLHFDRYCSPNCFLINFRDGSYEINGLTMILGCFYAAFT